MTCIPYGETLERQARRQQAELEALARMQEEYNSKKKGIVMKDVTPQVLKIKKILD